MDIQAKKLWLIEWLLKVQDAKILTKVENVMKEEHDFWDDLPQHVKDSIDRGLEDVKNGRVHTTEEVKKRINKKFNL